MFRKGPTVQRTVRLQTLQIVDEASFHLVFKDLLVNERYREQMGEAGILLTFL